MKMLSGDAVVDAFDRLVFDKYTDSVVKIQVTNVLSDTVLTLYRECFPKCIHNSSICRNAFSNKQLYDRKLKNSNAVEVIMRLYRRYV